MTRIASRRGERTGPGRSLVQSIRALADSARRLSAEVDEDTCLAVRCESFHDCVRDELGAAYAAARVADDFALAVASLAVVAHAFRDGSRESFPDVVEFACRHPVCRAVWTSLEFSQHESQSPARGLRRVVAAAHQVARKISEGEGETAGLPYFVERLAAEFDPLRRRQTGVYFTPTSVVKYLVERTDQVVRTDFNCADGLASVDGESRLKSPPLNIIDPAMGSGVFLLETARRIETTWRQRHDACWSEFVSTQLLPRLHGLEIMPASFVVAYFLLAQQLIESGFAPQPDDRMQLQLRDTLATTALFGGGHAPTVVLGNPPYRGLSAGGHEWIVRLMHGDDDGRPCASYYHAAGEAIAERKHWLHDDYVKFFRWGQWQIEQAGAGVLALVTNHGFLDNPTFRGMRSGLLETFPHIELVDLQGNAKKGAGDRDASVFATAQGMATTIAWRSGGPRAQSSVRRAELYGSRESKLQALGDSAQRKLPLKTIHPRPPYYFLCAHDGRLDEEYAAGFAIPEIMPVGTTAAVTARDSFVIDIDRQALIERMAAFGDLRIADDEIRRRFFNNSRSAKYPPGDTRGWKLPAARRLVAADLDWQRHIRPCWYRPGDRRWILWTHWMIDWPRHEVMRHMDTGNVALVCRRQMLRGQPCNFFWVADDIVIDGYIRSDNRGSESVFPLYVTPRGTFPEMPEQQSKRTANLSPGFLTAVETQLDCEFIVEESPAAAHQFHARDVLHFIYAVFHSTTYRQRYAEQLRIDFPRVLLPRTADMFWKLAGRGEELVRLHLLRGEEQAEIARAMGPTTVAPGWPKFADGRIWISPQQPLGSVDQDAWEFRAGAHRVLRKWLKDRRGRQLGEQDVQTYRRLVFAIIRTLGVMAEIEDCIQRRGGWASAFSTPS